MGKRLLRIPSNKLIEKKSIITQQDANIVNKDGGVLSGNVLLLDDHHLILQNKRGKKFSMALNEISEIILDQAK